MVRGTIQEKESIRVKNRGVMQNCHIISSLNAYIENPDPRYALMLKGKWGCGKTYLVSQWIEDAFKNIEKKDDVVLEPIRISLYGMTATEQITKAIDRQLHPFLYSKFAFQPHLIRFLSSHRRIRT